VLEKFLIRNFVVEMLKLNFARNIRRVFNSTNMETMRIFVVISLTNLTYWDLASNNIMHRNGPLNCIITDFPSCLTKNEARKKFPVLTKQNAMKT